MADYTAFVIAEHLYNLPNLFSANYDYIEDMLANYSQLPFDGTALGEIGYDGVNSTCGMKYYSNELGSKIEKITNMPAELLIFILHYCPKDSVVIKTNASKVYQYLISQDNLHIEKKFYKLSKYFFGDECVIGVHNKFYNLLTGEDLLMSGINWSIFSSKFFNSEARKGKEI